MVRQVAPRPVTSGMVARIREFDWSTTPLGPYENWPQSLRTAVEIILANRYPMFLWWGDRLINIYNDAYSAVLGKRHPGALGKPAKEVWSDIWATVGPQAEAVFRDGIATWNEELLLIMERNDFTEETYFTFSYSPVVGESGQVDGMLGVCTEETAKVLGRRRLKTLRDLGDSTLGRSRNVEEAVLAAAATLADNPYDVPFALVYLLDVESRRAHLAASIRAPEGVSSELIELGGPGDVWAFQEVLGSANARIVDGLQPVTAGAWPEALDRAVVVPLARSGMPDSFSGFLVSGVSPRLQFDEDYRGFLELAAGQISTAIANAKAYEEERRRADALAELDRAKTAFFSNVSHEFRTPLTLMLGPLENVLSKDGLLPAEDQEQIETAHRNSLRLLKLVNSLLDFSRIEAGRATAYFEPVDLTALTVDLASNFRSLVQSAGLEFVVDCRPLPQPVWVDREMWEKIVLNLLSNAYKFTFEGRIAVRLMAEGEEAVLVVEDTGVGITESELPKVFDRFHRVEGVRGRTYEGTGIGLALIQELVKLHDGAITAESRVGEGSRFVVRVPAGRQRTASGPARVSTAVRPEAFLGEASMWVPEKTLALPASTTFRPRILVADDNADMREHVARILGSRYELVSASDGFMAVEQARAARPELVLLDVMMPRLDGFGVLRELRSDPDLRELPVILISARAGEEARTEGIAAGADDYVTKPFAARELIARVENALHLQQVRREAQGEVKAASERLQSALKAARTVAWEWDVSAGQVAYSENSGEVIGIPSVLPIESAWSLIHPDDVPRMQGVLEEALRTQGEYVAPVRFVRPDNGAIQWMELNAHVVADEHGAPVRLVGTLFDITVRHRAELLIAGQKQALEAAVSGAPLEEVLRIIARVAETQSEHVRAAILLVDPREARLRMAADGSLPADYGVAVDGIPIAPDGSPSAIAAFTGRPQVLRDIEQVSEYSSRWDQAREMSIRGCWAQPICTSGGKVLGTISLYHSVPREPDARELDAIGYLAQTAAILIERDREMHERISRTAQFETLLNQAPLGVFLVDSDFRIREVNPQAQPTFGFGDVIGRDFDEVNRTLWPKPYADEISRRFRHTLETGEPYVCAESCEQRLDRDAREYYEWRIDRIPLPEGRFGVVCYFREISEQVLARERIALSEERFRAFVTASSDAVYTMNADWTEMRQLQGRDFIADVRDPGSSWLETYIDVEDRGKVLRAIQCAIESRSAFQVEHRVRQIDGSLGWTFSRAIPLFNADGSIREWFGAARDITEQKRAEERLRFMAESMPQKIFTARPDGTVDYYNQQWFEFAGVGFEHVKDMGWTQFVHPDDVAENVRLWRHCMRTGEPFQLTHRFRRADGEYRWHLSRAHAMRGLDGQITMWIGSNTDIHEQKRTEEELRRANEDLEQFAYTATHDLQEPLRGVKIYSELLTKRYAEKFDGEALEFLGYLRSGASRMEMLVRDLLSYTQVGRTDAPAGHTEAGDCLRVALANLSRATTESEAQITNDELPSLPVHNTHLQQLFQNLIGNAIKYRSPERAPRIHVSATRRNGTWLFSIADNGIGIEPEYRERIFGLFKRLHSGGRYEGTGIGLTICQRIVDRYHGRIWVDSEPGRGSTFYFTLPV